MHPSVILALPSFTKGLTFYLAMLRTKVIALDPAKSLKRKFGDKDEWRAVLRLLHSEGAVNFDESRSEIVVPLPSTVPDA